LAATELYSEAVGHKNGNRVAFIDSLRAIAAGAVLLQHIAGRLIRADVSGVAYWNAVFVHAFDAGRFGVGVFFIVSGYVVPFSLKGEHAIPEFVIKRFFRLYPVYWVSMIGGIAVLVWHKHLTIPVQLILANASMLEMALGVPVLLGPYWTLIIELAFYFACACLFALGKLRSLHIAVIGMGVCLALCLGLAAVSLVTGHYLRANLPFNMALMFYGLIIRRIDDGGIAQGGRILSVCTFVLAAVAAAVLLGAPDRSNPMFTPVSFLSGYLAAIVVFHAIRMRGRGSSPVLVWLAAISYPVYLCHEIVLLFLEDYIGKDAGLAAQLAFFAVALAIVLLIGAACHRWIEQPSISLGRELTRTWRQSWAKRSTLKPDSGI